MLKLNETSKAALSTSAANTTEATATTRAAKSTEDHIPLASYSKHSILDCGTMQIFVRLERLHEATHKFDWLSSQEGHFPRWPSEGR